jgi:lactate dehydrogenase-like 2-hydroxyacid dehydrogenase
MARCFVTRKLPGGALDRLGKAHELDLWSASRPPSRDVLLARAGEAEGVLTQLTETIDAAFFDACPSVRVISNYAVGVDNVDLAAATERGVPVGHTPGVLTDATADLTFALLLAAARRLHDAERASRFGDWSWEPDFLLGHDVHGAVLGLIGMGRIGSAVAQRASGFSMEVIHTARSGGVPLDELLERSDYVSIHAPLTPETRGLIGEDALRRMKTSAILVNTARGPIVDTNALVRALNQGWIAGAALDVTDPEPLPGEHPLLMCPNLTLSPHIGSATHATRAAMADMAVDNLLAALAGERMPHCANPEVYER